MELHNQFCRHLSLIFKLLPHKKSIIMNILCNLATDFIMEPELLKTVAKFIRCGGDPETFVRLLCENYVGIPQVNRLKFS